MDLAPASEDALPIDKASDGLVSVHPGPLIERFRCDAVEAMSDEIKVLLRYEVSARCKVLRNRAHSLREVVNVFQCPAIPYQIILAPEVAR
jgi:hypothetical protein